jgi:hypothetical protein
MNLSRTFVAAGLVAALAVPSTALAQGDGGNGATVGFDAAVVLPLGDYADYADLALGPLFRIEVPVMSKIKITGRTGLLYHLVDGDDVTVIFFPIYGGVRYSFGEGHVGPYVAGELGITFGYFAIGDESDTESELGLTLGGGFRKGALDFRGSLFIPSLDNGDVGLMGSVGYDFASF